MDLPGIYSLSPYTISEEVVARNYLINEMPDADHQHRRWYKP